MKRKMKFFVDDSYWISLLDEHNPNYEVHRGNYEKMVRNNGILFTSNFILGLVFDYLKKNISLEIAEQFYHFILRSSTLGDLKISWVGKKISKEAINFLLTHPDGINDIDLQLASNLAICKNKRIKFYLSDRNIASVLKRYDIHKINEHD